MHRILGPLFCVTALFHCGSLDAEERLVSEEGISFTIPNVVEFLETETVFEHADAQIRDTLVWATTNSGLQFQVTILAGSGGMEDLERAVERLRGVNSARPGPGSAPNPGIITELTKDNAQTVLAQFTDEVENSPGAVQIAHLKDKQDQGVLVRSFTLLSRDSEGKLYTYISARVVENKFVTTAVTHATNPRTPEQTADLLAFLRSLTY